MVLAPICKTRNECHASSFIKFEKVKPQKEKSITQNECRSPFLFSGDSSFLLFWVALWVFCCVFMQVLTHWLYRRLANFNHFSGFFTQPFKYYHLRPSQDFKSLLWNKRLFINDTPYWYLTYIKNDFKTFIMNSRIKIVWRTTGAKAGYFLRFSNKFLTRLTVSHKYLTSL